MLPHLQKSLDLLDKYLRETPKKILRKEGIKPKKQKYEKYVDLDSSMFEKYNEKLEKIFPNNKIVFKYHDIYGIDYVVIYINNKFASAQKLEYIIPCCEDINFQSIIMDIFDRGYLSRLIKMNLIKQI